MLMAPLQPGGPHRAGAGQQVRAGVRLFDALRRLRRRVRTDQGRLQDQRLPAGEVAQPRRGRARPDPADPGEHASPSRPARSCAPARSTRTRFPTTAYWTAILELYVDRDQGREDDRRAGLRRRDWSHGPADDRTPRSTSAASTRRARRSPPRASARTAACRSRTAGGRPPPRSEPPSRPSPARSCLTNSVVRPARAGAGGVWCVLGAPPGGSWGS